MAAVKAAGLVETLQSPGPFTVFAPTNAAFQKLPAGTVDILLKPENKPLLQGADLSRRAGAALERRPQEANRDGGWRRGAQDRQR